MTDIYAKFSNIQDVCIIGDIHSSSVQLEDIINQAYVKNIYKFIFLGDLWDRGVDPNGVIDIIMKLRAKGQLHSLLVGNHCWKFIRYFSHTGLSKNPVSIKYGEQQLTLSQLTAKTIDAFLELYHENGLACVIDYNNKIFLSHAGGGRPNRILEKIRNDHSTSGKFLELDQFSSENFGKRLILNKNIYDRLLYGIVDHRVPVVDNRPVRLLITTGIDDMLEEWNYYLGHIHANTFYPEAGNKQVICLDFSCGEPDGSLAAAIVREKGKVEFLISKEKT